MRRTFRVCAAVLVLVASCWIGAQAQQQDQTSSQASPNTAQAPQVNASQPDPLVEAARKARAQKKDAPKAAKVFTNDDIPTQGAISTVGTSDADVSQNAQDTSNASTPAAADDEKTWKGKFAELHHKLEQDQAQLDVLQREANTNMLQYYGGDPQKAAQDQASQAPLGKAYDKKVSDIDAMKKQIEADQQAISDAEDDLHKAGGDPGWAR
jgi:hypothetical protein